MLDLINKIPDPAQLEDELTEKQTQQLSKCLDYIIIQMRESFPFVLLKITYDDISEYARIYPSPGTIKRIMLALAMKGWASKENNFELEIWKK